VAMVGHRELPTAPAPPQVLPGPAQVRVHRYQGPPAPGRTHRDRAATVGTAAVRARRGRQAAVVRPPHPHRSSAQSVLRLHTPPRPRPRSAENTWTPSTFLL